MIETIKIFWKYLIYPYMQTTLNTVYVLFFSKT